MGMLASRNWRPEMRCIVARMRAPSRLQMSRYSTAAASKGAESARMSNFNLIGAIIVGMIAVHDDARRLQYVA
jgi:hypothetical protein